MHISYSIQSSRPIISGSTPQIKVTVEQKSRPYKSEQINRPNSLPEITWHSIKSKRIRAASGASVAFIKKYCRRTSKCNICQSALWATQIRTNCKHNKYVGYLSDWLLDEYVRHSICANMHWIMRWPNAKKARDELNSPERIGPNSGGLTMAASNEMYICLDEIDALSCFCTISQMQLMP